MAKTFECGFVRATLLKAALDRAPQHMCETAYTICIENFAMNNMNHHYFNARMKAFLKQARRRVWKARYKKVYMNYFSIDNWHKEPEKSAHTIQACVACHQQHHLMHNNFLLNKELINETKNIPRLREIPHIRREDYVLSAYDHPLNITEYVIASEDIPPLRLIRSTMLQDFKSPTSSCTLVCPAPSITTPSDTGDNEAHYLLHCNYTELTEEQFNTLPVSLRLHLHNASLLETQDRPFDVGTTGTE